VQGKTVAAAASQGITVAAVASLGSTDEGAASMEEGVRVDVGFTAKVEVGQRVMGLYHGKKWFDATITQVVANEDGLGQTYVLRWSDGDISNLLKPASEVAIRLSDLFKVLSTCSLPFKVLLSVQEANFRVEVKEELFDDVLQQHVSHHSQEKSVTEAVLKEAQAPRDKMDSFAEALECAVCYDVLGEETVSFTCGHLYCNRKACGSRDVEICPECRAPVVSRTKLCGGVARLKQLLDCKVVTTDVQSVQHKAGTWAKQSFEQIHQRRDQEKTGGVKEREREQEERRGKRERATKHARELQHRLSEVERERVAAKESSESEILESKHQEERKRVAHAGTSTVLDNLKKEMSDLQTAHSQLQNSYAVV